MRVAAVDCGTNSLRLLIADLDPAAGVLREVDRRMEIVRLGQGIDRAGQFDPRALARTLAVTEDYARRCREAGVDAVRFVATSATRDAADRDQFFDGVRERLGVLPEVITGDAEARLSFSGATLGLAALRDRADLPVLVVDIGGGSTEFVLGTGSTVEASISVDIGCVRLTERHGGTGAAFEADVAAAIDRAAAQVPWSGARALIGLAGSVTTVTAHALRLPGYDSTAIHGAVLPIAALISACDDLVMMDVDRRAALPYMHPGRVDVIGAGAGIWRRILARVGADAGLREAVASEHDILDGVAWSLAGR